jgi:hypothetical protein
MMPIPRPNDELRVPHPSMFKGAGFVFGKGVPDERESVHRGEMRQGIADAETSWRPSEK